MRSRAKRPAFFWLISGNAAAKRPGRLPEMFPELTNKRAFVEEAAIERDLRQRLISFRDGAICHEHASANKKFMRTNPKSAFKFALRLPRREASVFGELFHANFFGVIALD